MSDELVARGRRIVESGTYAPPRGEYLGRIKSWALDVFANSSQEWIDAWIAEVESRNER